MLQNIQGPINDSFKENFEKNNITRSTIMAKNRNSKNPGFDFKVKNCKFLIFSKSEKTNVLNSFK